MELFGTAGIRGDAQTRVTPSLAVAVGQAVARDVIGTTDETRGVTDETRGVTNGTPGSAARSDDQTMTDDPVGATSDDRAVDSTVVVARDGRVTGPALESAMIAGLSSGGAEVRRAGVLPTPALAHASRGRYGVMLTASHNPPHDNGIKLFADGQEFDRHLEGTIETAVRRDSGPTTWDEWSDPRDVSVVDEYLEAVVTYAQAFGAPLDGLRIAVDCGNGMAALATPQVLQSLGAEVVTLNANVDGHFPGRPSKPTPETLTDLREFVADTDDGDEFAFGIGHDGDADRIVIVDPDGAVVHEDTVVAILAEHYTRAVAVSDPVVVTTPNASGRIDERVEAAGGRVERVRLGALHEGIASARGGGGDVVFAAEPWKHIHPGFGGWIDGVASAAILASLVAEHGLASLREPVSERPYRKVSIECPDERKVAVMAELESTLPNVFPEATVSTDHGVRLELAPGEWLLVRPSGTEPYIRLYAESDGVETIVETARDVIQSAISS